MNGNGSNGNGSNGNGSNGNGSNGNGSNGNGSRAVDGVTVNDVVADQRAIADLVRTFFAAFSSGPDCGARLDALREIFLPQAVVVRTGAGEPAVYTVDSFIAPRRALLTRGTLVDFREWDVTGTTQIFGDIAQHFGSYAKSGVQDGTPFTARGMKTLQFIRTGDGWRISAAAWDDERDGLEIERDYAVLTTGPG